MVSFLLIKRSKKRELRIKEKKPQRVSSLDTHNCWTYQNYIVIVKTSGPTVAFKQKFRPAMENTNEQPFFAKKTQKLKNFRKKLKLKPKNQNPGLIGSKI